MRECGGTCEKTEAREDAKGVENEGIETKKEKEIVSVTKCKVRKRTIHLQLVVPCHSSFIPFRDGET